MASLHHLPKDEVESKIWSNHSSGEQNSLIDDLENNEINGKAFGQFLETIDILNDGSVVIASDNLHGIYQSGYVTKYERIEDVPHLPILSLTPGLGGICNVIPMRDKTLICGFDSGTIFKLSEGLEELISVVCHDNQICRMSADRLQTKSISGGYDSSLIVLDLNTFIPIKSYKYAHSSTIWDNAFNQFDDNLVLSCSRDKDVLLWDLRKALPASKVKTIETEPTALCWSSIENSEAYVGTACGEILLLDIRNPRPERLTTNSTSKRVHRIKNILNGRAIAVCSDDNKFLVLDAKTLKLIYENKTSHSNWVRGVAEHNHLIYTVGRDTRLVCHSDFNTDLSSIEMSDTSVIS